MEAVDDPMRDSDDSDSLPDLFGFSSSQPSDIKEGDIVWAKYRQYYWPSLVRKVYKKDKKASLWYLDTPRKCFKVTFKNIHSFNDRDFSLNVQKEAINSPIKDLHEKILNMTLCYIRRKIKGYNDDPGEYFDRTKHYLSLCDLKARSQANELNSIANQSTVNFLRKSLNDGYKSSSDEESVPESDEEDLKITKFWDEIEIKDEDYCPEDKASAIVDCIIAGKVDKHLLGILSRKIPSQRNLVFDEYLKSKDLKLLHENSPSIMIKDRKKYLSIYNHLQNYYESIVEKGSRDQFNYVMYVWFPDALDKAVALIENKSNGNYDLETAGAKRQLFASEDDEKQASNENEDRISCFGDEKNQSSPRKQVPTLKQSPKGPKNSESANPVDVDLSCPNESCVNVKKPTKPKPVRSRKGRGKKKSSPKMAENIPFANNSSDNSEEGICSNIKIVIPTRKKTKLHKKLMIIEPSSRVTRSHRAS